MSGVSCFCCDAKVSHLRTRFCLRIEALEQKLKEAVSIGSLQAQEWDRFWKAMGVLSEEITVDQAIEKYQALEQQNKELKDKLDNYIGRDMERE